MYTRIDLQNDLKAMGLNKDDVVMVHASMKSLGEVEGRADEVIDGFMDYFKEGLFMMPAHTWKQMGEDYKVFDPKTEPACVGILPNVFLKKEGAYRSLHPTHSVVAAGKLAEEYVKGDEFATTPCPKNGCFGRLLDVEGKILLVGVTHIRNTFIHAVEEMLLVPERFTKEAQTFYIRMPQGDLKEVAMYRHYNPTTAHISESYDKMLDNYFEYGAAKRCKLLDADCILCDAKKIYEITKRALKGNINAFMEEDVMVVYEYE